MTAPVPHRASGGDRQLPLNHLEDVTVGIERPILFSGPMIAAIQAGRKTQTRRVVKPQPGSFVGPANRPECEWTPCAGGGTDARGVFQGKRIACPFGRPGDRLWVRESFGFSRQDDDINEQERVVCYRAVGPCHITDAGVNRLKRTQSGTLMQPNHYVWEPQEWRPSIHMPRWASRITLEITGVRVERLHDISADDAKAEGLASVTKDGSLYKYGIPDLDGLPGNDNHGWHWQEWERDPRNAYHKLWEQINGPGSAVANPLVWAISFRRVTL